MTNRLFYDGNDRYYRATNFMPIEFYENLSLAGKKYATSLFFQFWANCTYVSKKDNASLVRIEKSGNLKQNERVEILRVGLSNFLDFIYLEKRHCEIEIHICSKVIWSGHLFFEMIMDILIPFEELKLFKLSFGSPLRGVIKINDQINTTSIQTLIIGDGEVRYEGEKEIFVELDLGDFHNVRKLSIPFITRESYLSIIKSRVLKEVRFTVNESFGNVKEKNTTLEHLHIETFISLEMIKEVADPFESLTSFTINCENIWSGF